MQRPGSKVLWSLANCVREAGWGAPAAAAGAWRAASSDAAAPVTERAEGVKSTLFRVLGGSPPLTSAEIWEKAEAEGVKSKRHMKLMLQDLKLRGWVSTRPPPADSARRDRAYRYLLSKKAVPAVPKP